MRLCNNLCIHFINNSIYNNLQILIPRLCIHVTLSFFNRNYFSQLEMANKLVPVSIVRTRPHFDGKSLH